MRTIASPIVTPVARVAIGVLFLAAAGLKLHGFRGPSLDGTTDHAGPLLRASAIFGELILGGWLISGKYRAGSWLGAIGTLGTFAVVSFRLGWIGQASCGCFGRVPASPWFAFALDVTALGVLGLFRPDLAGLRHRRWAELRRFAWTAGALLAGAGAILGVVALAAVLIFGSTRAALAHLRNESLSVTPSAVQFDAGKSGDELEASVEVGNWTDRPVRLIGGKGDCSCLVASQLPVTIPLGETRAITLKLRVPPVQAGGMLEREVLIWTDYDDRRTIRVPVGCRVQAP